MTPHELNNKRILVVGSGVTGLSVMHYLQQHEIAFDLADESLADSSLPDNNQLPDPLSPARVFNQFEAGLFCNYQVMIISPGVPRAHPAVAAAIAKGVVVIGDIELFAKVVNKPVIAVTGSNGKSTVVSWLFHVLDAAGKAAVLCGNIGQSALASLNDSAELYVLELSSYQLESTASLHTLSAVVLNISDDHMDRYASLDDYAKTKRIIFQACQFPVANHDDLRTWPATDSAVYFSLRDADNVKYHTSVVDGATWLCRDQQPLVDAEQLQMPGAHNIANALAVIALLEPLELDDDRVIRGLIGFRGLPHRTELIRLLGAVRWYNDSKGTNVEACIKAIQAMPGPVILIAGGLAKGADFTPLQPVVKNRVKFTILIGQDRQQLADVLQDSTSISFARSMHDAVQKCRELSTPGDVVLLSPACSSFDMFDNFEHRGQQFIEAVEALAA